MTAPVSFDFFATFFASYKTVWDERRYIATLMVVPFIVQFLCTFCVVLVNAESFIQQGLISIPAFFTQGWFLAQFLRTVLTGERWPYLVDLSTTLKQVALVRRVRGLLSAIIAHVLTLMAIYFLAEVIRLAGQSSAFVDGEHLTPRGQFFSLVGFGLVLAFFRFTWLVLPLSVNIPFSVYAHLTNNFFTSMRLLALWMLTSLPGLIIFFFGSWILLGAGPEGKPHLIQIFLALLFQTGVGLIMNLISYTALACALKDQFKGCL